MIEQWKIVSIDAYYEVSNHGRVRSLTREVATAHGAKRTMLTRVLKPFIVKSTGYMQVGLSSDKRVFVHRLVAEAFCARHGSRNVVNHKDGNRQNNFASNLEWVTQGENIAHSFRELGRAKRETPVIATCLVTGIETYFRSMAAAQHDGYFKSSVCHCCKGLKSEYKGFAWRYARSVSENSTRDVTLDEVTA